MSLKRKLLCEIRCLLASPAKVIFPCAALLFLGICTWISCRGVGIIWRISKHPAFSPPLPFIVFFWCVVYLLYGVIFSLSASGDCCSSLPLKTLVSYLATLFWCPLLMVAGNLMCSVSALALSLVYLVSVVKVVGKYSAIATVSFLLITIYELYMTYFTVVYAVIN